MSQNEGFFSKLRSGAASAASGSFLPNFTVNTAFGRGMAESIGYYEGGFLDYKTLIEEHKQAAKNIGFRKRPSSQSKMGRRARRQVFSKRGFDSLSDIRSGSRRIIGKPTVTTGFFKGTAAGRTLKTAGKFGLRAIAPATTLAFMYQGYKEGGILGAVKEGAFSIAMGGAFHAGIAAVGGFAVAAGLVAPAVLAATVVYAGYQFLDKSTKHAKGLRNLELGTSNLEAIGSMGASTMRQRSIMALNKTHINGRMVMGNEALLLHNSF